MKHILKARFEEEEQVVSALDAYIHNYKDYGGRELLMTAVKSEKKIKLQFKSWSENKRSSMVIL